MPAIKGSPMKRAKLRRLKRNAAVALGEMGMPEDVDILTRALEVLELLLREHAAWAVRRITPTEALEALRPQFA